MRTLAIAGAAFGFMVFILLAPADAAARWATYAIDADTGEVLHAVNEDTRNYPASLTKMMTLYMVFEALEGGRLHLDQRLPVSRRAAGQPPSKLGLRAGESISVRDAILALVTKSANDVATVVAEALGETEYKFALAMTARARDLGMRHTTFRNASGLPNRGQLSTARDMAVLATALLRDFPGRYRYFSTRKFTFRGRTYGNHNDLLASYDGVDGIKTGYIRASGFNLVASAERNGRRVIGVVMGGRTSDHRNAFMVKMLDDAFARIGNSTTMVARAKPPVPSAAGAAAGAAARVAAEAVAEPTPAAGPDLAGRWGVQVGAYYRYRQAEARAMEAIDRAARYLGEGVVRVEPLQNRRRVLYRARVVGLTKRQAYRACRALEAREMACMEFTVPDGFKLAAVGH